MPPVQADSETTSLVAEPKEEEEAAGAQAPEPEPEQPYVPFKVQAAIAEAKLGEEQAQAAVPGEAKEEVMCLHRVYMIRELDKGSRSCFQLALYMLYLSLLLYLSLFVFPQPTTMLRQRESIQDVLLDEEFAGDNASYTDLVFKKNFQDARTAEEFWQFVWGPLMAAVWPDEDSAEPGMLLMNNFLVGAVQFRQVRVKNVSCGAWGDRVLDNLAALPGAPSMCYPDLGEVEQHPEGHAEFQLSYDSYGAKNGAECTNTTESCLYHHTWHDSSVDGSVNFRGTSGKTRGYGNGGFAVELSRDHDTAKAQVAQLEQSYIDEATRMVAISLNLYNANRDIFVVTQLGFEFDATGHVEPSSRLVPLMLMDNFFYTRTSFGSAAFWLMVALASSFAFQEIYEWLTKGRAYFFSFWNWYEIIDIACFVNVFLSMAKYQEVSSNAAADLVQPDQVGHYYDAGGVRERYREVKLYMALNLFTAVLKVFKFMGFSKKVNALWEVLILAFTNLAAFGVILMLITAGFATFGCMLYGDHVRQFHNVGTSMSTLLYFSIGDYSAVDYLQLKEANSAWTPIYILLHLVFVCLMAVNMFIAILGEAHSKYEKHIRWDEIERKQMMSGESTSVLQLGGLAYMFQSSWNVERWSPPALEPEAKPIRKKHKMTLHIHQRTRKKNGRDSCAFRPAPATQWPERPAAVDDDCHHHKLRVLTSRKSHSKGKRIPRTRMLKMLKKDDELCIETGDHLLPSHIHIKLTSDPVSVVRDDVKYKDVIDNRAVECKDTFAELEVLGVISNGRASTIAGEDEEVPLAAGKLAIPIFLRFKLLWRLTSTIPVVCRDLLLRTTWHIADIMESNTILRYYRHKRTLVDMVEGYLDEKLMLAHQNMEDLQDADETAFDQRKRTYENKVTKLAELPKEIRHCNRLKRQRRKYTPEWFQSWICADTSDRFAHEDNNQDDKNKSQASESAIFKYLAGEDDVEIVREDIDVLTERCALYLKSTYFTAITPMTKSDKSGQTEAELTE